MKKILILGGADIQISAIRQAKEIGYRVITCDYLPDNPGHRFSDEYHNVSTTDKEAVLRLAERLRIDGISSYASDPGALTAAYVSERLGIPGIPFASVDILSNKFTFRGLQQKLGIECPKFIKVASTREVMDGLKAMHMNAILKPVDTSGSKGIYRFRPGARENTDERVIDKLLADAMQYSRAKMVVLEEFIERKGFLKSGDFIIEKGKILFACFGDVHFNTRINGLVPRSISLPASGDPDFFSKAVADLQQIVTALNVRQGVFNADVIETQNGKPVVVDIGARNGGNMFNDIIHYHSGVNLIDLSLRQCCGEEVEVLYSGEIKGYFAHNVIHADEDGTLDRIEFSREIEPLIIFRSIHAREGQKVSRFINSSFRLGLILLQFKSFAQMHEILGSIHEHVKVFVKK